MMIFNRNKLRLNFEKSRHNIDKSKLWHYAHNDLLERLSPLKQNFSDILLLGANYTNFHTLVHNQYPHANIFTTSISKTLINSIIQYPHLEIDEEALILNKKFDLIIYSLGLNWINDIMNLLSKINYLLTDNGIFITNFAGHQSFRNLRLYFIHLEEQFNSPHSIRIIPFINFDDVPIIMQKNNFAETIIDLEKIALEYQNAFTLIKAIKKLGASNILTQSSNYSISKAMYNALSQDKKPFSDELHLITVIGSKNKKSINLL